MPRKGIKSSVKKIFESNKNKKYTLKDIYTILPKYYNITSFQKQPTPNDDTKRPRYKNQARSAVYALCKEGTIQKHSHNCYYFKK